MPSIGSPATDAPLWRGIASAVERAILAGELPVGSRLPGAGELAGSFGASRGTVVRAVRHLRAQGLIEPRQGVGTFVSAAQRTPPTPSLRIHAAEPIVLQPAVHLGPALWATAAARGAIVGRFRVLLWPGDRRVWDELADLDVLAGNRGWDGCRRRTEVDLDPVTAGPSLVLRTHTEITHEFTGRTCSITAHLSPEVFSVDVEQPLESRRPARSGTERKKY